MPGKNALKIKNQRAEKSPNLSVMMSIKNEFNSSLLNIKISQIKGEKNKMPPLKITRLVIYQPDF